MNIVNDDSIMGVQLEKALIVYDDYMVEKERKRKNFKIW